MGENDDPLKYLNQEDAAPPKAEPLQGIETVQPKESILKKGVKAIISEDASTVGGYIVNGVLKPSIRSFFHDAMTGAADIMFGGGGKQKVQKVSNIFSSSSYEYNNTPYSQMYQTNTPKALQAQNSPPDKYRAKINREDLIFKTLTMARDVLMTMQQRIQDAGYVTVQDLYDICGKGGAPAIATEWGWFKLEDVEIYSKYGGWYLDLPACVPIKKARQQ